MEAISNGFPANDFTNQQRQVLLPAPPPPPVKEKTKRPQLSCNPCRARKVKCDRIQPCTACSLHQIAEICRYDLSETERQPILQAEALKEKDKAIAHLRNEVAALKGEPVKCEAGEEDDVVQGNGRRKFRLPPRELKRSASTAVQKGLHSGDVGDSIYFGTPGMTNVVEEFAYLSFDRRHASMAHTVPRGTDFFAFQMATSHPFPTLFSAKDDTSSLIKLLPPEQDLFLYLDAFQRRAQPCSFPHVPDECTNKEVRRFLENPERNAALHPDMLALLFTTLAQGTQDGVYDKYGEKWVAGSVEIESKMGDVYLAVAMQCLRLNSFMNRPTLLAIETLIMMGPYLTNSGRFLDASALFGLTVRLAQSIGLHRDPNQLNPPAPPKEVTTRKNLWWWMLHMDQNYSMALGRPLAISSMGDCPSPEQIIPNPVVQSLSSYIAQFSILGRQILSAGRLNNDQIDRFTDDLLALQNTLPNVMLFDVAWLNKDRALPGWPLDAQAGILHAKTHNFLILLNRQRIGNVHHDSHPSHRLGASALPPLTDANHVPRGRERVLQSCRALLCAFEFFQTRVRAAMICWTMGQMAFNASMILTLSMLETGETQDLLAVQHTYSAFLEMNKLGIHKLAGAAVERLGHLMKEFRTKDPTNECVMGQQGMMLLEDPGLQGSLPESFTPLNYRMAGGTEHPDMRRANNDFDHGAQASQHARKRSKNKAPSARDLRGQQQKIVKKAVGKSQRPLTDRRFSDSVTPKPNQRRRPHIATDSLSLISSHPPGQSVFSTTSTPTVKNETLFSPETFDGFPAASFNSPAPQPVDLTLSLDNVTHGESINPHHPHPLSQHHAASDPGDHTFNFSNHTTPPFSSEFFDDNLPSGAAGFVDPHLHHPYEHQAFSASPFDVQGVYTAHF